MRPAALVKRWAVLATDLGGPVSRALVAYLTALGHRAEALRGEVTVYGTRPERDDAADDARAFIGPSPDVLVPA